MLHTETTFGYNVRTNKTEHFHPYMCGNERTFDMNDVDYTSSKFDQEEEEVILSEMFNKYCCKYKGEAETSDLYNQCFKQNMIMPNKPVKTVPDIRNELSCQAECTKD